MSSKVVPSLSDKGWVFDTQTILAKIMSFYILTDSAQSLSFQGNLTNLPETYYRNINQPMDMAVNIRQDLDKLLSRYFSEVEVITDVRDKGNNGVAVLLYAYVVDDSGIKVSLGKVVEMDNDGLRRTIDINNVGEGKSLLS